MIDLVRALRRCESELPSLRDRFAALHRTVDSNGDLGLVDYAAFYALLKAHRPGVIVEVGRQYGNSTAVFAEYAARHPGTRVTSVCLSDLWQRISAPRLAPVVGSGWFAPLDVRTSDVREFDLEKALGDEERVVFFWDAHGADLAEYVIGRMFPILARRRTLVIVHDILAILPDRSGYREFRNDKGDRLFWIPPWRSCFEELIYLADFWSRNGIRPRSPSEPRVISRLHSALSPYFPGSSGFAWVHFPLDPAAPLAFPEYRAGRTVYDEILARSRPRLVAWGAGGRGRHFLSRARARGIRVEAFVDSDPAKWGTRVDGMEVRSPDDLRTFPPAETLVAITTHQHAEVARRLRREGFPPDSLLAAPVDYFENRWSGADEPA